MLSLFVSDVGELFERKDPDAELLAELRLDAAGLRQRALAMAGDMAAVEL